MSNMSKRNNSHNNRFNGNTENTEGKNNVDQSKSGVRPGSSLFPAQEAQPEVKAAEVPAAQTPSTVYSYSGYGADYINGQGAPTYGGAYGWGSYGGGAYANRGNYDYRSSSFTSEKDSKEQEELLKVIAPALYSYHIGTGGVEESTKENRIMLGADGLYVARYSEFNGNSIITINKTDKAPGLSSYAPGIRMDGGSGFVPISILSSLSNASARTPIPVDAEDSYSYHLDKESFDASDKPNKVLMGYDGIYLQRTIDHKDTGTKIRVLQKTNKAPHMADIKPAIKVEMNNRVPYHCLRKMLSYFNKISAILRTESAAQVYRRKDNGEYFVYFPKQTVSGANVKYADDMDAVVNLRNEHTLVMEAHSHNNFSAFFSGGDNANEKFPCAFVVIGNVLSKPSFRGRVKVMDQEQAMTLPELFDLPEGMTSDEALSIQDLPAISEEELKRATTSNYSAVGLTAAEYAEIQAKQAQGTTPINTRAGGVNPSSGRWVTGTTAEVGSGSSSARVDTKDSSEGQYYEEEYDYYEEEYDYYGTFYGAGYPDDYYGKASRSASNEIKVGKRHRHDAGESKGKGKNRKSGSKKLDVEWISDNINIQDAICLIELLADKIEGRNK